MFFKAKTELDEMAFGVIPAYRKYELYMERFRSISDLILASRQAKKKLRVLDAGCGPGYLKYFCPWKGVEFTGADYGSDSLKICKALGYKTLQHDVSKGPLPFKAGSFDVVVASHMLEHLYDPAPVLKDLYRLTAKGGLLIVGLPMHPGWAAWFLTLKNKIKPNSPGNHQWFFSKSSLTRFFKDYPVMEVRGFRLLSARRRTNWEDHEGFYKFNVWFGKKFPYLTPEVNVVIRKSP